MPQIPDFTARVGADPGGVRPGYAVSPLEGVAGGLEAGLRPIQEWADKYQQAKRVAQTADFENANTKALAELEYKWSKTPDRAQAMAGFDADVAALKKQNLDTIEDPLMRAQVGVHFNDQAVSRGLQTGNNAFNLESSAQAAKLDQAMLDNSMLAGKADNDNTRAQITNQTNRQIDSMAAAGWISPEKAVALKANFNNDVASVSAQQDIDKDPYGTKKRLQGEGYQGLLPQQRQNLIGNADSEIKRRQAEAERRANEAKAIFVTQQGQLYDEELAAAQNGKRLNVVSLESLTKAHGAENGARLWQNLQDVQSTSIAIDGMALKPPDARHAEVEAAKPETTAPLPSADIKSLDLTAEEKNLYQYHVTNLVGGGAVKNADGSYSSVSQTSQEHEGRFYNLPTVWGGEHHTEDQAVARANQQGWEQWPSYASRDEAETRYQKMHAFMEKDSPDAVANTRYKEQQAVFDTKAKAAASIDKSWADDSAQAAITFSDPVKQGWLAANADPKKTGDAIRLSIQTQHDAGVAPGDERILTKGQVDEVVHRIHNARGDDATNIMQSEAQVFGPEYWNKAYGELVKGGLDPAYQVLATTPPGAASDAARLTLSRQLEAGPDATKTMASASKQAVDSAVDDTLTHWTSTIRYTPDGPRLRDSYGSAVRLVAYSYVQGGQDPKAAATRAANELLLNKYDFVQDSPHFNARAPRGSESMVKTMSMHVESTIAPADMPDPDVGAQPMFQHPELTPEARKLDYYYRAIQNGQWVTNNADNGWLLLDQTGLPVTLANGKTVAFTYADAEAMGLSGGVLSRQKPKPKTLPGGIAIPEDLGVEPMVPP